MKQRVAAGRDENKEAKKKEKMASANKVCYMSYMLHGAPAAAGLGGADPRC